MIAPGFGERRMPIRPKTVRTLRQPREQGRLCEAQVLTWLPEVAPARGSGADQVSAKRSTIEIFNEDRPLALRCFDLRGADRLLDLSPKRSNGRLAQPLEAAS